MASKVIGRTAVSMVGLLLALVKALGHPFAELLVVPSIMTLVQSITRFRRGLAYKHLYFSMLPAFSAWVMLYVYWALAAAATERRVAIWEKRMMMIVWLVVR